MVTYICLFLDSAKLKIVCKKITTFFKRVVSIAINLIFNHNPNLNITKKELKKLYLFSTLQTHFIFNSKFYNQTDGAAMGSPLSPVLANITMGFYESK